MTGDLEQTSQAIRQIQSGFLANKRFRVGCPKRDTKGFEVKNGEGKVVTATAVREVLPMRHSELLELSMVINDDEWSESTHLAATKTNGHLLHAIKD